MITPRQLLRDLTPILRQLEDDIRERSNADPVLATRLRADHAAARDAKRTAEPFSTWLDDQVTQSAVAWILNCVFVRFIEDNGLVAEAFLAGPGDRLHEARDRHTQYVREHPSLTDRDYLMSVFDRLRALPAIADIFDPRHNPAWNLHPSGDGGHLLLTFFQRRNAETDAPVHDFRDPAWSTRFLGDIYQDLSESARKKYALLQTPEFVEEFILARTLTPAIQTFGLKEVRLIDPTCGSGHFILGAFRRILAQWFALEPATNPRELVQRALQAVHGVDLNPFAVAIARFRLLVAALEASGIQRLKDAPAFHFNLAAGDSLLHGARPGDHVALETFFGGEDALADPLKHVYETEDRDALQKILGQPYHAVVGNPPFITAKDKALNEAYRQRFLSCCHKYSLGVPFTELFFDLAIGVATPGAPAGYVGLITANSFMKREFGKKLVEEFIPRWDLTHVIDTAGAYIPGHGTPTVILFGRHQKPVAATIRTVMGIKGEPATPADPAHGLVWSAIVQQLDQPGSESPFISVADSARTSFHKHPWSIGGGGAAELKEILDQNVERKLGDIADQIGITSVTGEDDLYLLPDEACARRIAAELTRPLVLGDNVRDWTVSSLCTSMWLYDGDLRLLDLKNLPCIARFLWPARTNISKRRRFGTPMLERGLTWYEWQELYAHKLRTPLSLVFGFVATHNHFVLDRGGKVFNRSAPVIKLPAGTSEDTHLALLGLLNSSVACFWGRQTFFPKGGYAAGKWEERLEWDSTKLASFPVPAEKPLPLASALDSLAQRLQAATPATITTRPECPTQAALTTARSDWEATRLQMIALQEELDWECYRLYGILDEALCAKDGGAPHIRLGERAFEIVMARQMAAGELQTTWFARHGSTPITEIPAHWPEPYRQLVARRIEAIEAHHNLGLIEQPEYKRRWNTEPWDDQLERALRAWLLNRLEERRYWPTPELTSAARLADRMRQDTDFMQVAELYRNRPDFDLTALLSELVLSEAVPLLPSQRYKPAGLRKRTAWEQTWELQRQEDAIEAELGIEAPGITDFEKLERQNKAKELKQARLGDIPVPPKYTSADFLQNTYWKLRGKLDVPKERFILFPGCGRDADPTPVFTWAGFDHLQQAQAIAGYYEQARNEGWTEERRLPLLAAVLELIPWLKQWHNEVDPTYNMRLGDYYAEFLDGELRTMGMTVEELGAQTDG
jgi:hypothetical protein